MTPIVPYKNDGPTEFEYLLLRHRIEPVSKSVRDSSLMTHDHATTHVHTTHSYARVASSNLKVLLAACLIAFMHVQTDVHHGVARRACTFESALLLVCSCHESIESASEPDTCTSAHLLPRLACCRRCSCPTGVVHESRPTSTRARNSATLASCSHRSNPQSHPADEDSSAAVHPAEAMARRGSPPSCATGERGRRNEWRRTANANERRGWIKGSSELEWLYTVSSLLLSRLSSLPEAEQHLVVSRVSHAALVCARVSVSINLSLSLSLATAGVV